MPNFLATYLIVVGSFVIGGPHSASAQVITSDVDLFWSAYDSIIEEDDLSQQIDLINSLYIDVGSDGLRAFIDSQEYTDSQYVHLINKYPRFWASVRENTLQARTTQPAVESYLRKLTDLFPEMTPVPLYYVVGALQSGGTAYNGMVLMGTEVAAGDRGVDVSEFSSAWLAGVFEHQTIENLVVLAIHEYVHTQQYEYANLEGVNVGAVSLMEGTCDFITELVVDNPLPATYLRIGRDREPGLINDFLKDFYQPDFNKWLYNGGDTELGAADMGYFMGYTIAKAYYENARDKSSAIKFIITSDWTVEVLK